jgi:serine phosphatase RsbU (regulator of sigma subunit)
LVAVLDVLIPRDTAILTVMYGFAPLIACAVLTPTATAAVAIAATAMGMLSGWWNHAWGSSQHLFRMADVVLIGAAAVVIAAIRLHREEQIARLVAIADVAQRAVLPTLPAQAGTVAVAARYVSAAKDAMVGGDLYDCYRRTTQSGTRPERVRFIVGDVRGKGIAGVEQAARVIRAFRQAAAIEPTLPLVAQDMDRYLRDFFSDEDFVTAILVDVSNPEAVELVSCGHPPALLCNATDGHVRLLDAPAGLPLGTGLADARSYREIVLPWTTGDRLLLYTDGLSEARDASGAFLSPLSLEPALQDRQLPTAMDAVLDTVARHAPTDRLSDDLALLLLEHVGPDNRQPSQAPHTPRE